MNIKSRTARRIIKVRGNLQGSSLLPRLSVYRSNKFVYAQIIDDGKQETIVGVSEAQLEGSLAKKARQERAKALGQLIAKKARDKKIEKVVFDRGGYAYHGLVKAVAEGAREGGLQF